MHSIKIATITVGLLAASSSVASAGAYDCKESETQPECFARLQCHADEELEDCQKRLRAQSSHDNDNDRDNGRDNDRDHDRDRGRDSNDHDRGRRDRNNDDDHDRGRSSGSRGGRRAARGRHRQGGGGGGGGHGFVANKTFGLGLELGEPSGLNGKYFFSDQAAFDFGLGVIYDSYYYGDGAHLYGDFLYHPVSLASTDAFELPLYVGVGLRFWDFDYCDRGLCDYHSSAIGVRIPFGLSFDFNRAPIDIFLQLVPVIDFVGDDYYNRFGDREHAGIDGSVGFRFWFK